MKCKSCGSNLAMEMSFCPYCGAENEFAKKHREDMQKYSEDYKKTKREVLKNSKTVNRRNIRITAVAVTIAAIACAIIFLAIAEAASYDIRNGISKKEEKEYIARIEEYMEDYDYLSISELKEQKIGYVKYKSDLFAYRDVLDASQYYNYILREVFYAYGINKYEHTNTPNTFKTYLQYLYEMQSKRAKDRSPKMNDYVDHVVEDAEKILTVYFDITKEQIANLDKMTDAEKLVLFEGAYAHVQNEK